MFNKTICSDFFTTINFNLYLKSLKALTFNLPNLRKGKDINHFNKEFLYFLGLKTSKIISFYNGRSALYNTLKLIKLTTTDEVIVNSYTCVSVVNAVKQSGAKIVYSDINKNNFGFLISSLEKQINKNTKVIIVQHTFGKNSNISKIIALAKKHNLLVIEDCAHSLGTKVNSKQLGSFGDFAIFSTGRDKVISSVNGGFLVINNPNYFLESKKIKNKLKLPSKKIVIQNLLYNIVAYNSYKSYDFFGLGKIIIYISRKLNLIPEILTKDEKLCNYNNFNLSFPNSLATLAIGELEKINFYNNSRKTLAEYYDNSINNENFKICFKKLKTEKNNYFRYPILVNNKININDFYNYMKKNHIILGKSWSHSPIAPIGSDLSKCDFTLKDNPNGLNISNKILFLPNHPMVKLEDAVKITKLINNYK